MAGDPAAAFGADVGATFSADVGADVGATFSADVGLTGQQAKVSTDCFFIFLFDDRQLGLASMCCRKCPSPHVCPNLALHRLQ